MDIPSTAVTVKPAQKNSNTTSNQPATRPSSLGQAVILKEKPESIHLRYP